jgi:DNA-binding transcriptional LysR family regulator
MRTSRSLSMTEAGRDFYESAVPLISGLEAAESRIGSGQTSPSGVVRVTAAPAFSRLYVVPQLPAFRARYPKVVVESLVSERTSNLGEESIDLAIRNGALSGSSFVARKIRRVRRRRRRIRKVSGTQRRAHAPRRSRPPRRGDFRLTGGTATLNLR